MSGGTCLNPRPKNHRRVGLVNLTVPFNCSKFLDFSLLITPPIGGNERPQREGFVPKGDAKVGIKKGAREKRAPLRNETQ